MKKLVIIGAGGHGKVCAEIAHTMHIWEEILFLDDEYPNKKKCLDFQIVGKINDYKNFKNLDFFVAIGNNEVRKNITELLEKDFLNIVKLVHPSASISKYCKIGRGTSVHQYVVINTEVTIGRGCIVNTSSIVDHESLISDFVHISPGVNLAGRTVVGSGSWIGIGATVINNVSVSENVIIGAHSLVISDIDVEGIYYGVPSKNKI